MATVNQSSSFVDALLQEPPILPPPGITANLDGPLFPPAYAVPVAVVAILITTSCIALRLITQVGIHKRFGLDDGK